MARTNCPFPLDFVTLPEEDQATATGNMHRKMKMARVVPEICLHPDRQTHTHTDVLIASAPTGEVMTVFRAPPVVSEDGKTRCY